MGLQLVETTWKKKSGFQQLRHREKDSCKQMSQLASEREKLKCFNEDFRMNNNLADSQADENCCVQ